MVSLNVYNGNFNFFCVAQMLIEFSNGGTVFPSYRMKVVSRDIWDVHTSAGEFDWSNIGFKILPEVFLYLFTLVYVFRLVGKAVHMKRVAGTVRGFFQDVWNLVELLLLLAMVASISLRFSYWSSDDRLAVNIFDDKLYHEMGPLAAKYAQLFIADSLVLILITFKCLKYFQLQSNLSMLRTTLGRSILDILTFSMLMVVFFIGFSIMGLNIFGAQVASFRQLDYCVGTLFLVLLGEFDYDEMRDVDELWAIIFFVIYVLFMFFIILNIFLAILNDAYTVVHASAVWETLDKSKRLSLREKFEVRKAMWRERKSIRTMQSLKRQRVREAKFMKREYEKREAARLLFEKRRKRKRRLLKMSEVDAAKENGEAVAGKKGGARKRNNARQTDAP